MLRDAALGACIALSAVVLSGDEPVCVVGVELCKSSATKVERATVGPKARKLVPAGKPAVVNC